MVKKFILLSLMVASAQQTYPVPHPAPQDHALLQYTLDPQQIDRFPRHGHATLMHSINDLVHSIKDELSKLSPDAQQHIWRNSQFRQEPYQTLRKNIIRLNHLLVRSVLHNPTIVLHNNFLGKLMPTLNDELPEQNEQFLDLLRAPFFGYRIENENQEDQYETPLHNIVTEHATVEGVLFGVVVHHLLHREHLLSLEYAHQFSDAILLNQLLPQVKKDFLYACFTKKSQMYAAIGGGAMLTWAIAPRIIKPMTIFLALELAHKHPYIMATATTAVSLWLRSANNRYKIQKLGDKIGIAAAKGACIALIPGLMIQKNITGLIKLGALAGSAHSVYSSLR